MTSFRTPSDLQPAGRRPALYNEDVARGWESKSVESQMESAEAEPDPATPGRSRQDLERERKKESLLLSRTRVLNDLACCHNDRYRVVLEAGLAFLDGEIQALG